MLSSSTLFLCSPCKNFPTKLLMTTDPHLQFLFSHSLSLPLSLLSLLYMCCQTQYIFSFKQLQSGFHAHQFNKTTFVKISNDLHVTNSVILLDLLAQQLITCSFSIHFPHLTSRTPHTPFWFSFYLNWQSSFAVSSSYPWPLNVGVLLASILNPLLYL